MQAMDLAVGDREPQGLVETCRSRLSSSRGWRELPQESQIVAYCRGSLLRLCAGGRSHIARARLRRQAR